MRAPLTCQGTEGEEEAEAAAHGGGVGAGALRSRVLGQAPAGTGQLSRATVSCSQQPRGPGRDR